MLQKLFSCLLFACLLTTSALAENRAAFIVGNSDYRHAPRLKNPVYDAKLVASTLEALNFKVAHHKDLTREGFSEALGNFLSDNRDADVTLFYFAGHGMQYDGQNYLVATDARLRSELDIDGETIALDKVVDLLERNSKAALVFVDACRDNPLATDFYRRNFSETRALETRGLARVRGRSDGSMQVFAAAPGQVAYDGDGLNSPFALALAKHLPTENKEILSLTKRIIRDVREETNGQQSPIVTNDLTKEIFLREAALRPLPEVASETATLEEDVFKVATRLRSPRAWARYFDLFPKGTKYEEALELEAEVFRNELRERIFDPIRRPNMQVNKADFPTEAVNRLGLVRNDILAIQAILSSRGYDPGGVDGAFGKRTITALAAFQRAKGLVDDGVPDRATLAALGLRTASGKWVDRFPIANQIARVFSSEAISMFEDDPRLARVVKRFSPRRITYGYFEGRLYVAMMTSWGTNWSHATFKAEAAGGHLATINSREENEFIVEMIRYDEGFWVPYKNEWVSGPTFGLLQRDGAPEPAGGWEWYNGEPRNYINWVPGFPNNNRNRAKYGAYGHPHPAGSNSRSRNFWGWDDYENVQSSIIIEIP